MSCFCSLCSSKHHSCVQPNFNCFTHVFSRFQYNRIWWWCSPCRDLVWFVLRLMLMLVGVIFWPWLRFVCCAKEIHYLSFGSVLVSTVGLRVWITPSPSFVLYFIRISNIFPLNSPADGIPVVTNETVYYWYWDPHHHCQVLGVNYVKLISAIIKLPKIRVMHYMMPNLNETYSNNNIFNASIVINSLWPNHLGLMSQKQFYHIWVWSVIINDAKRTTDYIIDIADLRNLCAAFNTDVWQQGS